jgi:hypothetical protein
MSLNLKRVFPLQGIHFKFGYYNNVRAKSTVVSRIPLHKEQGTIIYQCMEAYGGMEVHQHAFLTSVLDGVSVF